MTPTKSGEKGRALDLKQADEILEEYTKPYSMIDNGNLFFAACEYQEAFQALKEHAEELLKRLEQVKKDGYGNRLDQDAIDDFKQFMQQIEAK